MRALNRIFLAACNVLYRATGGLLGGSWFGAPILLLTTTGRRSGERRVSGLVFLPDGERFVVVASDNGAPRRPSWYYNLQEAGGGEVQYRRRRLAVSAYEAHGDERARLWPQLLALYGGYDTHEAKAGRPLPVMVLTPRGDSRS